LNARKEQYMIASVTPGVEWTTHSGTTYKVKNGTYYHRDTPDEIIRLLEAARLGNVRLRFHFGNTNTGRDWCEEFDVVGTIGRSMGPVKVPLLLQTSRSIGGGSILDHCIVRIRSVGKNGRDIYRHPKYHTGTVKIETINKTHDGKTYTRRVTIDGEEHAAFRLPKQATAWCDKMGLTPA
jgi:hypothetical protein